MSAHAQIHALYDDLLEHAERLAFTLQGEQYITGCAEGWDAHGILVEADSIYSAGDWSGKGSVYIPWSAVLFIRQLPSPADEIPQ